MSVNRDIASKARHPAEDLFLRQVAILLRDVPITAPYILWQKITKLYIGPDADLNITQEINSTNDGIDCQEELNRNRKN